MSAGDTLWEPSVAPEGFVFLCEITELLDGGTPNRQHIVPPPILAKTYSGGSNGMIYLPEPCAYGAFLGTDLGPCPGGLSAASTSNAVSDERSFFPFALPFPSLLIPSDKLSIRIIPEPACLRWPPYAWPLAAGIFGTLMDGSLASRIADATHTPFPT